MRRKWLWSSLLLVLVYLAFSCGFLKKDKEEDDADSPFEDPRIPDDWDLNSDWEAGDWKVEDP